MNRYDCNSLQLISDVVHSFLEVEVAVVVVTMLQMPLAIEETGGIETEETEETEGIEAVVLEAMLIVAMADAWPKGKV